MKKLLTLLLAVVLFVDPAYSQRQVTGKVTQPGSVLGLPGVTVQLADGTQSTLTDYDGSFQIQVSGEESTLIFELEGYEKKEIQVGSKSSITVKLSRTPPAVDKKVETGFGSLSKEENTSTTSTINAEDLGNQPVVDLEQANQGRAAGVFIQNSGGKLGQGTKVRIRGGSSLSGSNEPLYVVDGVPLTSNNQSDIDPSTIESIEILKDASAAALYGSRAANGVVLIKTKSGESGKLKVDIDYQLGASTAPKRLDLMDAEEYNILLTEFFIRNLGTTGSNIEELITREQLQTWYSDFRNIIATTDQETFDYEFANGDVIRNVNVNNPLFRYVYDTDWQDQAFRTGLSHRANVGLSGGTEKHQVYTGLSYLNQEGFLIGNQYERFNGSLNVKSQFSDKLSSNLSFNYVKTKNNQLNEDADAGNPMQVILLPPADEPVPSNDYILRVRSSEYNPQTEIFNSDYLEFTDRINGTLALGYEFTDELSLKVDGGIDYSDIVDERRQGPVTLDGRPNGLSRLSTTNVFNYLVNGYLSYNKKFTRSSLSAIAGSSFQKSNTDFGFRLARVNSIDVLRDLDESDPSLLVLPIPSSAFSFLSYYSRVNYTFDGRYSIQLSGRVDGSSKFGEENRFGFFPAVSGAWNISNEDFLADNSLLSFLKLKASYGIVGNTPDADFLYRQNYFTIFYGNDEGLRLSNLSNAALRWESTAQTDVGVDFGFFSDRLTGSINYYNKQTTDLIFPVPVSQTSGFTNVLRNTGSMTNSGFEFAISSVNVSQENFSWTTDFNISSNQNEITDLGGERLIQGVNTFQEGQPAGAFFLPEYRGVNPATGEALYTFGNGTTTDYNTAVEFSRSVQGNPNPRFFGGLTNQLSYANFDLNFTMQFVQDVDVYWETGEFIANSGFNLYGQTADQNNRWYRPGDQAPNPKVNPNVENTEPSTRWLVDGSYIRMNNISLSYSLPDDFVRNIGLRYFTVYVGGQNLFTITNYPGYDPDVGYVDPAGGALSQNITRGIDFFTAPQPRIYTTGLKIGF